MNFSKNCYSEKIRPIESNNDLLDGLASMFKNEGFYKCKCNWNGKKLAYADKNGKGKILINGDFKQFPNHRQYESLQGHCPQCGVPFQGSFIISYDEMNDYDVRKEIEQIAGRCHNEEEIRQQIIKELFYTGPPIAITSASTVSGTMFTITIEGPSGNTIKMTDI